LGAHVGALVVESTGDRAFCAGADRAALAAARPVDAVGLRSARVFASLAALPIPVIAAVQGPAVAGGFELALACDLRVAGPQARFRLPETALGLVPAAGGTSRLVALVGGSRARELVLAGRELDAETALAWGVVHRVAHDPRAEALAWAQDLATRDAAALAAAKRLLADVEGLDGAFARERAAEGILYARRASPDTSGR
jgi:enoyl-CoA hydratase